MTERPAGDRRLMVSASPSAYKIRSDLEHAVDCFDTLRGDDVLVESVVKSILRDSLAYLSNFDDANRLLISRCSRVDNNGYERPFEIDLGDIGRSEGAQITSSPGLNAIK